MSENIHFIPPPHPPSPRAEAKGDGPASTDDDFDADLAVGKKFGDDDDVVDSV